MLTADWRCRRPF